MTKTIQIGNRTVGEGYPTYIVAEIGINHNGDMEVTKELIRRAKKAGVDAIKLQKRTPELCVPLEQRSQMRDTPWGYITYMDYRQKVEFGKEEYEEIDRYCKQEGINWFVSVWDEEAADFMEQFDPVCYKAPSASLTDLPLLRKMRATGRPIILSSGMSTMKEIDAALEAIGQDNMLLCHSTSAYPCPPDELNLRMINTLQEKYECPIGYSGHEVGLITSVVAASMGACLVERHYTLDRAMWGSDQSASVEPAGFERMVKYIRVTEKAMGDGVKRVYDSELAGLRKLRRVRGARDI
ncbi:MAG: N-acetylneuraminate synthase family protein [Anaerolineaceae bacterium]|nr:N-acetylneuraminate synthase family protein [Anaerolineaceae bacterium]